MDLRVPQLVGTELAAAYFQAVITLALVGLFLHLHRRYGKVYFRDWALAWGLYALRLGAIISFLHTGVPGWLYWHQVLTGWTALALLWAALVFAQQGRWRQWYWLLVLFPPVWSWVAIYRLDHFMLAAGPAVAFLSLATLLTAGAFFRYHREAGSAAARILAFTLLLWALHHLDYPVLRARGIWNPWGYYLDLFFTLGVAAGILLLIQEDLDQGLEALSSLSGELQSETAHPRLTEALLERAVTLKAVRGSALFVLDSAGQTGHFTAGAGACSGWPSQPITPALRGLLDRVVESGSPQVHLADPGEKDPLPYTAALPVFRGDAVSGALVVVGRTRDPFTALNDRFLFALGQQVGAALQNAELNTRLALRSEELEALQGLLVQRHEVERARISRELHDETAQILAAVNLQLGMLSEGMDSGSRDGLERARHLVGEGIRSVRRVTRNLRPVALDDLGLSAAVRALVRDFDGGQSLAVTFEAPQNLPRLGPESELTLYRAAQEALSNTARHAEASQVRVRISSSDTSVTLEVEDDGCGFSDEVLSGHGSGSSGLAGMKERSLAQGGSVTVANLDGGGARLSLTLPAAPIAPLGSTDSPDPHAT